MLEACLPSISTWSICFLVFWSGDNQVALWILRCWNLVVPMISCRGKIDQPQSIIGRHIIKADFPIVSPNIPFLATLALKSTNAILTSLIIQELSKDSLVKACFSSVRTCAHMKYFARMRIVASRLFTAVNSDALFLPSYFLDCGDVSFISFEDFYQLDRGMFSIE